MDSHEEATLATIIFSTFSEQKVLKVGKEEKQGMGLTVVSKTNFP